MVKSLNETVIILSIILLSLLNSCKNSNVEMFYQDKLYTKMKSDLIAIYDFPKDIVLRTEEILKARFSKMKKIVVDRMFDIDLKKGFKRYIISFRNECREKSCLQNGILILHPENKVFFIAPNIIEGKYYLELSMPFDIENDGLNDYCLWYRSSYGFAQGSKRGYKYLVLHNLAKSSKLVLITHFFNCDVLTGGVMALGKEIRTFTIDFSKQKGWRELQIIRRTGRPTKVPSNNITDKVIKRYFWNGKNYQPI